MITNLFDRKREKRRIVHFDDIPKVMVDAVLSAEDKHFFQHPGFDPIGLVRAAFVDLKDMRYAQGSSTLTMQLARTMLSVDGAQLAAQDSRNLDHAPPGTEAHQAADFRVLRQLDLSG